MKHPNEKIMRSLIGYTVRKGGEGATGCFIVKGSKVISRAVPTVDKYHTPTDHAEMNAIRKACRKRKSYYLRDCWVYSTQIPCPMCASAIVWSEAKGIVYGFDGRKTWGKLDIDPRTITKTSRRRIDVFGPFMEKECSEIEKRQKS